MLLISVATVLVLAIAFYQVVQGLFSSLIMTLLTILSAAVAFNYYEPLAGSLLYSRQPGYADSISLIALFFFLLLGLRLGIDRLIPGNVALGTWADRIGGGVLGVITGVVITGVLMVAIQMLPFSSAVMGYNPFDGGLKRIQSLAPFKPDEAVLGMMKGLSNGTLSSEQKFGQWHSDLLLESFCMRNRAEKFGRADATPGTIRLQGVYVPDPNKAPWCKDVPYSPLRPDTEAEQGKVVVVRVTFEETLRDDADNWLRVVGTQLRLTTRGGRDYYPVAYLTCVPSAEKPWQVEGESILSESQNKIAQMTKLCAGRENSAAKPITMDWVFRLPLPEPQEQAAESAPPEADADQPARVIFRRTNTVAIEKVIKGPLPLDGNSLDRKIEPVKK